MTSAKRVYDPMEQERRQRDRRLVFVCLTVALVLFTVMVMLSDMFLRRDDIHYHGTDPGSWDVIGTVFLGAWIYVAVRIWRDR